MQHPLKDEYLCRSTDTSVHGLQALKSEFSEWAVHLAKFINYLQTPGASTVSPSCYTLQPVAAASKRLTGYVKSNRPRNESSRIGVEYGGGCDPVGTVDSSTATTMDWYQKGAVTPVPDQAMPLPASANPCTDPI